MWERDTHSVYYFLGYLDKTVICILCTSLNLAEISWNILMKKLEQECVKINGKKVLAIGNWQVFTCLAVAEPLDLGR